MSPEFRLREHAQSRAAWDLGDAEQQTAEVRFTGASGPVQAAMRDGEAVNGMADVRFTIEQWRRDYNEVRPHSSLANRTPAEYFKGQEQQQSQPQSRLSA